MSVLLGLKVKSSHPRSNIQEEAIKELRISHPRNRHPMSNHSAALEANIFCLRNKNAIPITKKIGTKSKK